MRKSANANSGWSLDRAGSRCQDQVRTPQRQQLNLRHLGVRRSTALCRGFVMQLGYPPPLEDGNARAAHQDALPSEDAAGLLHLKHLIPTLYESLQEQRTFPDCDTEPLGAAGCSRWRSSSSWTRGLRDASTRRKGLTIIPPTQLRRLRSAHPLCRMSAPVPPVASPRESREHQRSSGTTAGSPRSSPGCRN